MQVRSLGCRPCPPSTHARTIPCANASGRPGRRKPAADEGLHGAGGVDRSIPQGRPDPHQLGCGSEDRAAQPATWCRSACPSSDRDRRRRWSPRGPSSALLGRRDQRARSQPLGVVRAGELLEQERVAAGRPFRGDDQRRNRAPSGVPRQCPRAVSGAGRSTSCAATASSSSSRPSERGSPVRTVATIVHGQPVQSPREVGQRTQAGDVRPVRVVDGQQHGRLAREVGRQPVDRRAGPRTARRPAPHRRRSRPRARPARRRRRATRRGVRRRFSSARSNSWRTTPKAKARSSSPPRAANTVMPRSRAVARVWASRAERPPPAGASTSTSVPWRSSAALSRAVSASRSITARS